MYVVFAAQINAEVLGRIPNFAEHAFSLQHLTDIHAKYATYEHHF